VAVLFSDACEELIQRKGRPNWRNHEAPILNAKVNGVACFDLDLAREARRYPDRQAVSPPTDPRAHGVPP
jgi:hypothetical protein